MQFSPPPFPSQNYFSDRENSVLPLRGERVIREMKLNYKDFHAPKASGQKVVTEASLTICLAKTRLKMVRIVEDKSIVANLRQGRGVRLYLVRLSEILDQNNR